MKTANMCSRSPLAMAAAKVILFIALAGRLAGFSADPVEVESGSVVGAAGDTFSDLLSQ